MRRLFSKAGALGLAAAFGLMALAGCASAASGQSPAASGPATFTNSAQHPFVTLATWNFPDGYNPLEANSLTSWYQTAMVDPPLAFVSRKDIQDVVPGIASHWSMSGKTLSIFVNPKAKWSNGKPVTAQDMLVSLDISLYLDQWMGLSAGRIKVVNSHEVQVTEGSQYDPYFVQHVLGYTPVYSAAEFGHFMPKHIYRDFLLSNQNTTAGSNESTALSNLLKKMEAYRPNYKISCGPWVVQSNSTSEALFKPNPYFYDAKGVPEVEVLNDNATNQLYAWATAGKFTLGGVPNPTPPLVKEWLAQNPLHKVIYSDMWGNVGLDFNTSIYPYNLLAVRQALAYLINRQAVAKVANPEQATPIKDPVGYFDYLTLDKYLTSAERSQLNPYTFNPSKAKKMLLAAGFRDTGSGWVMPNGKPFVPAIYAESTASSWEAAAEVIKSDLAKIGISSKVYFIAPAVYSQKLAEAGPSGMPLALGWEAFSVHGYNSMVDALDYTDGVTLNYGSHYYTVTKGDIGLIPMKLPNGQKINVAKLAVGPNGIYSGKGAVRQQAIWKISLAGNYNLPMLPLWGQNKTVNYVNTQYYTGFPSGTRSPWWVLQNNLGPNWVEWFYQGLIKPTSAN